ncbi:L,D-transpeptidase family protein [Nitratireductor sp. XY-223]|uniref:L,D-transpeptidase family protein n=1 Tax=Nitratireductor sp. XY-223 TaxID=2561926 RepID=UPI001FEE324C|nr:L,D-transpeptidase family protein [Nitratireductor sp. XY-223]
MINRVNKDCVKIRALKSVIVRRHPRSENAALVSAGNVVFPAFLGRSGRRLLKREGDGATPRARMRVLGGFYRSDRLRLPQTRLTMTAIRSDDGWCDDPGHGAYNRPVRLPFARSHEKMMRSDGLYDICLVLDWNISERRRHRGSAIFLHLHAGRTTEGCIAVDRRAMLWLLPRLSRRTVVEVL